MRDKTLLLKMLCKITAYLLIFSLLSTNIAVGYDEHNLRSINPQECGLGQVIIDRFAREAPSLVEIEITNYCNYRCSICRRGNPDYVQAPVSHMPFNTFKRIIDAYDYPMKRVQFCGTSEPTANPDLVRMVRYVAEKKNPDVVELITNGSMLTPELSSALIAVGLNMLRLSIDGPDEETYQAIRRHKLEPVVRNVRVFKDAIAESGRDGMVSVWVNCVIAKTNIEKIADMPRFTREIGADVLELRIFETNLENLRDLAVHDRERLNSLRKAVEHETRRWGIKCDLWDIDETASGKCNLNTEAHINYEGYLTPCYHLPKSRVGDRLGDRPFSICWNSREVRSIIENAENGTPLPICNCLAAIAAIPTATMHPDYDLWKADFIYETELGFELSPVEEGMVNSSIKNWVETLEQEELAVLNERFHRKIPIVITDRVEDRGQPRGTRIVINRTLLRVPPTETNIKQLFLHGVVFEKGCHLLKPVSSRAVVQQLAIQYLKTKPDILDATIKTLTPDNVYLIKATPQLIYILNQIQNDRPQAIIRTVPEKGTDIYLSVDEAENNRLAYDHDEKRLYRHNPTGREPLGWYPGIEIDEHVRRLHEQIAGRSYITITDHNLYFNDFCLMFKNGVIYHKTGEFTPEGLPANNRTYTCLVAWKEPQEEKHFTIERLTFKKALKKGDSDKVYLTAEGGGIGKEITGKISCAIYGQQVIKDNQLVDIASLAEEFDDLRHLFSEFMDADGTIEHEGKRYTKNDLRRDRRKLAELIREGVGMRARYTYQFLGVKDDGLVICAIGGDHFKVLADGTIGVGMTIEEASGVLINNGVEDAVLISQGNCVNLRHDDDLLCQTGKRIASPAAVVIAFKEDRVFSDATGTDVDQLGDLPPLERVSEDIQNDVETEAIYSRLL